MSQNQGNKASAFSGLGGILIGIILLALVYDVFLGPGANMGSMGMVDGMHGNAYGQGGGLGFFLGGILQLIIKILSILLVIGLIMGIWVVVKDYLESNNDNILSVFTKGFSGNKMACPKCSSSVESRWDFCPDCGQALTKADKPNSVPINPAQ